VFADKGYRDATVREICKVAGSSNINSINYYFGGKELLYKEILDLIFREYDVRKHPDMAQKKPEERLRDFISINCELLYQGGAVESDVTKIFVAEMAKPSPFLGELADRYNRPRVENHLEMIREIIGHGKPEETVRNCLASIAGQILYYSFSWPLFSRLFQDDTQTPNPGKLAKHIYRFSMGGLMAIKQGGDNA
jgi:TetR/AcrR family transcriptional regulator, regulator of cefoperazone and chloramphenicol sensitivity